MSSGTCSSGGSMSLPGTRPLENLVQRLVKDGHLPSRLEAYTETIRKLGNVGAHRFGELVTQADVYQSLTQLLPILEWYFEKERPEAAIGLDPPARVRAEVSEPRPAWQESAAGAAASRWSPRGCGRSTPTTVISSCSFSPARATRTACPRASGSGSTASRAVDEPAFTVGVIYGPSGCGKSSLIKAGLLPRLAQRIISGLHRGDTRGNRDPPAQQVAETLSRLAGRSRPDPDHRRSQAEPGSEPGPESPASSSTSSSSGCTPGGASRTRNWPAPSASATASASSASSWCGMTSGSP